MRFSDRLTTPRRFLLAVGAWYLLAWVLPSVRYEMMGIRGTMDGLAATLEALEPIRPDGIESIGASDPWWAFMVLPLHVASPLTNIIFVLGLIHGWRSAAPARLAAMASVDPRPFRLTVWALGASAVVNLYWLVFWTPRDELRIGYYLWVSSFPALAVVLASVRRRAGGAAEVRLASPHGRAHRLKVVLSQSASMLATVLTGVGVLWTVAGIAGFAWAAWWIAFPGTEEQGKPYALVSHMVGTLAGACMAWGGRRLRRGPQDARVRGAPEREPSSELAIAVALVGAFFALWGAYVIWQLSYALTDPVFRAHSYRHFLGIMDALLFYVLPGVICVAAGTRPIRRVTMGSVQRLPERRRAR